MPHLPDPRLLEGTALTARRYSGPEISKPEVNSDDEMACLMHGRVPTVIGGITNDVPLWHEFDGRTGRPRTGVAAPTALINTRDDHPVPRTKRGRQYPPSRLHPAREFRILHRAFGTGRGAAVPGIRWSAPHFDRTGGVT